MKKDQRALFLFPTVVLGLAGMALRMTMLRTGFDEKGLLIPGHYSIYGIWGVSILYFVVLALLLGRLGQGGKFRDNFPKCPLSGGLAVAGGCLMAAANLLGAPNVAELILGLAASAGMIFTGVCRIQGRRPNFLFHALVCVYFIWVLIRNYKGWSSDPQLQDYACQMMALIFLMLFAMHRSCCDAGNIHRRKTVFTGLGACFLCLVSLSDGDRRLFFLAAGLWAAGSLCSLNPLPEAAKPQDAGL